MRPDKNMVIDSLIIYKERSMIIYQETCQISPLKADINLFHVNLQLNFHFTTQGLIYLRKHLPSSRVESFPERADMFGHIRPHGAPVNLRLAKNEDQF